LGTTAIELINVCAIYEGERIPTLHDITLTVEEGELVAIVGPNGAGKTTLLEVVNGLLPITTGEVTVLGELVCSSSHRLRQEIAYLPQDLFFDPSTPFLVKDVVLMSRFAKVGAFRFPSKTDRALVTEAMRAVGSSTWPVAPLAVSPEGNSERSYWHGYWRSARGFSCLMSR